MEEIWFHNVLTSNRKECLKSVTLYWLHYICVWNIDCYWNNQGVSKLICKINSFRTLDRQEKILAETLVCECVCLRLCVFVYVYACICVCVCVCSHIIACRWPRKDQALWTGQQAQQWVYMYVCECLYLCICTSAFVWVCTCVYVCVCASSTENLSPKYTPNKLHFISAIHKILLCVFCTILPPITNLIYRVVRKMDDLIGSAAFRYAPKLNNNSKATNYGKFVFLINLFWVIKYASQWPVFCLSFARIHNPLDHRQKDPGRDYKQMHRGKRHKQRKDGVNDQKNNQRSAPSPFWVCPSSMSSSMIFRCDTEIYSTEVTSAAASSLSRPAPYRNPPAKHWQ